MMAGAANAVIYTAPPGASAAADFHVTVDGREVFVYDTPVGAFASFALSGTVQVTVSPKIEIRRVDIRPTNKGIQHDVKGNSVAFTLSSPCNLSVEFNGNLDRPLFLFANPVELQTPPVGTTKLRYFEPGKIHEAGEITLGSDETLFIPGGAIVHGWVRALGAKNVRIMGQGILDASTFTKKQTFISLRECSNVTLSGVTVVGSTGWTVHFRDSTGIAVDNIKLIGWGANSDGLDIDGSQDVRVTHTFLYDADDCVAVKAIARPVKNVSVSDTVFWNVKAGNAIEVGFELKAASVSDIAFSNCDLIHVEKGAAFSVHVGDQATVRNISYRDIRVEDTSELLDLYIGLSIYSTDCPPQWSRRTWSDPHRQKIPPERIAQPGSNNGGQWIKPRQDEIAAYAWGRGHIQGVHLQNIKVTGPRFPTSIIGGFDKDHTIEDVLIDGLWIQGERIRSLQAGRFTLENCSLKVFPDL